MQRHGAAMIGAVAEKCLNDGAVAGDKAGAQSRRIGALGEAVKNNAVFIGGLTHLCGGLKQACRGMSFIEIDL